MTRPGIATFRKNLVRNPSFELGNTNWTLSTPVVTDIASATPTDGTKVLQSTGDAQAIISDDLIEVDATKNYVVRAWFRKTSGGTANHYLGVACYDANKNFINAVNTNGFNSTQTTLTSPCLATDTALHIASATGWISGVNEHVAFNIKDDGSDRPNRSISPSISSIVGTTLNLSGAVGHAYPAGTKIRLHEDAGSYTYAGAAGATTLTAWGEFVGKISGAYTEVEDSHKFRPGTKYVKMLALINYGVSGTVTQVDTFQFYEEEPASYHERAEFVQLLEMEFSDGVIRLATAGADIMTEPYAVRIGATTARYLIRNPITSVQMPNAFPTTQATVEYWGKLNSALDATTHPAHVAIDYVTPAVHRDLGAGLSHSGGTWQQFAVIGNVALSAPATGLSAVPNDQLWHQYVFTWLSAGGVCKMYRDGQLVYTGTLASGGSVADGGSLVIGQNQSGGAGVGFASNLAWDGDLDDVRIYNRVLSDDEVADHYVRRFANEVGIVANYRFDTATLLGKDSSVNAIHMKAVGMTAPNLVDGADLIAKVWMAVGGNLEIGAVEETNDTKGQGVDLSIDGIDQTVLAALLTTQWRGRPVRVYRAHFDFDLGGVGTDVLLLFQGYQLSAYTIEESSDRQGGTVSIKTRVVGYFAVDRAAGINSNLISHQHFFPGDTFWQNAAQLVNTKIYWGTPVPQTPGRGGPASPPGGGQDPNNPYAI